MALQYANQRALLSTGSELPAIAGVTNFTRANNSKIISAMTALKASSADVRVAYIGDSTVFGYNSAVTLGWPGSKNNNVAAQIRTSLTAAGIPTSYDDLWGSGEAGTPSADITTLISADSRITRPTGTGWVFNSFPCIGGKTFGVSAALDNTSTIQFATDKSANRCDVYFLRFASGGSFQWSTDGGSSWSGAISTVGADGMGVTTLNLGTSGTKNLLLRCTGGASNVFLIGLAFYDTNSRRLLFWSQGACGWTTAQIDAKTAAWDWGNNVANSNMGLNLAIIEGGLVNDRNSVADPTAAMNRIQSWITALKAVNCDVWLVNPEPVSDSTTVSFAYRDALSTLANTNNCTFVNLMSDYTTLTGWQGAGYGDVGDPTHPNNAGYGYIANRYKAMVQAIYAAA